MILYPQNLISISKLFQMSTIASEAKKLKQFTWDRGTRCLILNPRPFLSAFHPNGTSPSTRFEGSRGTTSVLSRTSTRLSSFRHCFLVRFVRSPTLTGPRLGKYYLVSFGCFSNMYWVWCWSSYRCLPKTGEFLEYFSQTRWFFRSQGTLLAAWHATTFLGSYDGHKTKRGLKLPRYSMYLGKTSQNQECATE